MESILYPPLEPFETGRLQVSELHNLYWERSGKPNGIPVVVIHGGPGGGVWPYYRQFFNPTKYHVIMFDQRGCGKSTPHAELKENDTWKLVSDIEKLRKRIGIERWAVFGGSWGSTLGLTYAENHPEKVTALFLRGIFMCRRSELLWFYQDGASHIFPDAFEPYVEHIPEDERGDMMRAYYRRLTSSDISVRRAAALQWTKWEKSTSNLIPNAAFIAKAGDVDYAAAFARIECHYFVNNIFLSDDYILKNAHRLGKIPTVIVQGRYDVVCPTRSAWDLKKVMPHAKLIIVPDAGHSMSELGIARELVKATDQYLTARL